MPVNILLKLFDIKRNPIVYYGAEIWGCKASQTPEISYTHFCKFVLGVLLQHILVSSTAMLAECEWDGLHVDYHVKCVNFWRRLIRMIDERYPRQCYLLIKKLDECGRTWATLVHPLFLARTDYW